LLWIVMRYGIISDVHSNVDALDAVLAAFRKERLQSFLCLGDIVGYGPNPNECIERIAGLKKVQFTGGSHDFAAVGLKETTCFIGHTHVPCVFYTDSLGMIQHKPLSEEPLKIDPQGKTIINAGSVGQPRDGDTRACGVIYDTETFEVRLVRCPYDIAAVQDKM